jgi:hypothetical protein
MGKPALVGGGVSSGVKAIIMIMRVRVVLLCEAVMRRAPVLKCLVPGAHGFLWLRPIMAGLKWCFFARIPP